MKVNDGRLQVVAPTCKHGTEQVKPVLAVNSIYRITGQEKLSEMWLRKIIRL